MYIIIVYSGVFKGEGGQGYSMLSEKKKKKGNN